MSEQKNLIMAIVLSVVILLGWQLFFMPDPPPPSAQNQQTQGQTPGGDASLPQGTAQIPGGSTLPALTVPQSRGQLLTTAKRIEIKTPRLSGSLRLKGARMDDLTLHDYRQELDPESPEVVLLNPTGSQGAFFIGLGWGGLPGVNVPGPDTDWKTADAVLTHDEPVTLTWDNGQGLRFIRQISVDENYMFTVTQTVENRSETAASLQAWGRVVRHGTPEISDFFILHEGPLGTFNEDGEDFTKKELDYSDLRDDGKVDVRSTGGWIGFSDKYWMATLIPEQTTSFAGTFKHWVEQGVDKYQSDFIADGVVIPAGGALNRVDRFFAGAKEVKLIAQYEEEQQIPLFDKAIDWGWFEFLTRPFFHAIDFFNSLLGNFGLAIICVTFVVKFIFLPLAWRSYVSMSKMKALQPEMMKLRERYPDDKMKLQQEMMALYKKNKVNPVSGCVPILLQIPVFFALYKVLFVTIEMRHAPFYGWIQDLSAPDPTNIFELFGLIPWDTPDLLHLGIWPLLMGGSMWLLQKMNPTPPDPMQARIMMMLPIVFTFFLARFPAGLVIYWTANNLLSILQQYAIKRRMANRKKQPAKST